MDGATAFQALENESRTPDSILHKLNIKLTVGRLINKNKNPVAENAVQEVLKEILRVKSQPGPITVTELAIVLKNINSRTRYHEHTPKEALFRRNVISNEPIDVLDSNIVAQQAKHKERSSKSSRKHNAKFKQPTPPQEFSIGDLVMLRNARTKNNPRETYIVEKLPSEPNEFILIRKMRNSLRPRLYKALPDELIHAPQNSLTSDLSTKQSLLCQETPEENLHFPNKKHERRSKQVALKKIRENVNAINLKKSIFKHGWKESDQDFEDVYHYTLVNNAMEPEDVLSINSTSSSSSTIVPPDSPATIDTNSSSSENEMMWDSTPDQYALTRYPPKPPDAWSSTPFTTSSVIIPPAFPRERNNAFSQPALTRSHAFRLPKNNQAFSTTPASRIPLPISPSSVNLSQVNDMSNILPLSTSPLRRRSTRQSRRPDYLGIGSVYPSSQHARDHGDNREDKKEEEVSRKHCLPPHSSDGRQPSP